MSGFSRDLVRYRRCSGSRLTATTQPITPLVRVTAKKQSDVAKRKKDSDKFDESVESITTAEVSLGESAEREIPASNNISKLVHSRKIHKRRKVPTIRKGKAVEDPHPTPPADLDTD